MFGDRLALEGYFFFSLVPRYTLEGTPDTDLKRIKSLDSYGSKFYLRDEQSVGHPRGYLFSSGAGWGFGR